jgi:hypothetical protein
MHGYIFIIPQPCESFEEIASPKLTSLPQRCFREGGQFWSAIGEFARLGNRKEDKK